MSIIDKVTNATQDAIRGVRDFTDTARQNSLINDEQKQIDNLFYQIGKLYYETSEATPDTSIGKLCIAINAAKDRIKKYQEEIQRIKGTRRCPSCGFEITHTSSFCGKCGANLESDGETTVLNESRNCCKSCGAELIGEVVYCAFCGEKQ